MGGLLMLLASSASMPTSPGKLPAGARVTLHGDSILHYTTYSTTATKEFSQSLRGEPTWLSILDPRFRIENWRDITRLWGPHTGTNGMLGTNPFATTNGSPTVTVTHTAHGLLTGANYIGGAEYVFSGATAVAGLTISGGYKVVSVPNANTFTITASGNANATTTGGGSSVAFKQRLHSVVAQYFGPGSNWATAADHTEGAIDILRPDNGFPSSDIFGSTRTDIALIAIGTNNINSGKSAASVQADLQALVDILLTKAQYVVIGTIRPRGAPMEDTLPDNPFTTTNGSATVTVSHPNHGYKSSQNVTFTWASAVAGLTLTGPYTISTSNLLADSYQISAGSNANATTTGGGSGVTVVNALTNLIYQPDDARWAVIRAVNEWIRTHSWNSRVRVADLDPIMVDPDVVVTTSGSLTGAAKRHYLEDGVHLTPKGAYHAGRYGWLPVLQELVEEGFWYETDPTVAGNYMRNGILSGTGGVTSTGCTGQTATEWLAQRTAGSSLTCAIAKDTHATGIDKQVMTFTSSGSSGVDTFQLKPLNPIAYNRASAGVTLTVNTLTSGANPTVRISQASLTNGHPIVGSKVTIANASGAHNGVTLNGTWTVANVLAAASSLCTFEIVATGQTASGTGSGSITADTTYSAQDIFPLDTWVRFGGYVDVGAWDKWRGVQIYLQARNSSTPVITYRAGRSLDENLRYMPDEAWAGWIVSDPIKLDSEALTNVTNFLITLNVAVENSTSGETSAALEFHSPFLRIIDDPRPDWLP